jgi:three-Cys-motif partner protein
VQRWAEEVPAADQGGSAMTEETTWAIEPHTKAKHELLRRYLEAWFPILSSSGFHGRVLFIDGFAGPGIYRDGEPGSPLIALDVLKSHPHFSRWNRTEFRFLFVESEADRFESLAREVEGFWGQVPGGRPPNVKVDLFNDEFANVAADIIAYLEDQKAALAPTLAFIDPFGWSGVSLRTISALLSFNRCEVLFNFMYDSVNRWVTDERPGIANHFDELFGTGLDERLLADEMDTEDRKEYLSELYVRQLREVAGFRFVRKFEMINKQRGRTAYFLIFGTRNRRGLEVMKDAMWKLDPLTGVRFAGEAGAQEMLFEPEPDFAPLRRAVLQRFAGRRATVEEVEIFVVDETDYKKSHYKKQVLKPLEEEGLVECVSARKRKYTYPPGTVLRFVSMGGQ